MEFLIALSAEVVLRITGVKGGIDFKDTLASKSYWSEYESV